MSEDTNPIEPTEVEDIDAGPPSPADVAKATKKPKGDMKASPEEELVAVIEETPEEVVEVVEDVKPAKSKTLPKSAPHIVGNAPKDKVIVSRIVFKNIYAKKSLSVHHIQRRLNEVGYSEAFLDKDGWYGDRTKAALAEFQKDNGLSGDGDVTLETMYALFENDDNVIVVA